MIDDRMIIWSSKHKATGCILALPGRGQLGSDLARAWLDSDFEDTMFASVTPTLRQWYPMPYSATDQSEAVEGLEIARNVIETYLVKIENEFDIPRNRIGLVGFSAGGVMANYIATHSDRELAGVVCHGGAILEPDKIPPCRFPNMPIVLTHCMDDDVFEWHERYVPMLNGLKDKDYNVHQVVSKYGRHTLDIEDIYYSALALAPRFGYSKEWVQEHKSVFAIDQEEE